MSGPLPSAAASLRGPASAAGPLVCAGADPLPGEPARGLPAPDAWRIANR